jgi:hypothetical protein
VSQYAVEVPIPRELIREADESRRLNVGNYLDISRIAMATASAVLGLDYELECAGVATTVGSYAAGHVQALAGPTKWSAATGTPVTDIRAAAEVIRKKIGKRPNRLILSADAAYAARQNPEVKGYMPTTNLGPATMEQLKTIFNVADIVIGEAVWKDGNGLGQDVWGNNAILAYVPTIGGAGTADLSLTEPAFGFTNVIDGHPFSETPYYDNTLKSWVYGGTYERQPNISFNTAAFLFQNPR